MIIDGKAISQAIKSEIKEEVRVLRNSCGIVPGLTVVIVGSRPDSQTYVKNKRKAANESGFLSQVIELSETISEGELCAQLDTLVADGSVHGILVQLPLPHHIDERRVLSRIPDCKDVDGFSVSNMGALAMKGHSPLTGPCTALGIVELLVRSGISVEGKNVVVLGRSNIVGLPVALLLMKMNATVTACHSKTRDLPAILRQADIVVCAIGRPEFVQADWLKDGVVVIDVGIHRVTKPDGNVRLVGDVDFENVKSKCSAITPVPGGVGPMTIAMLLRNCLALAKHSAGHTS